MGISFDDIESLQDSFPARKKLLMADAFNRGGEDKEEFKGLLALNRESFPGVTLRVDLKEYSCRCDGKELQSGISLNTSFEMILELFPGPEKGTGTVAISAEAGKGCALESPRWDNCIYTYTIINGLKNMAEDKNND